MNHHTSARLYFLYALFLVLTAWAVGYGGLNRILEARLEQALRIDAVISAND